MENEITEEELVKINLEFSETEPYEPSNKELWFHLNTVDETRFVVDKSMYSQLLKEEGKNSHLRKKNRELIEIIKNTKSQLTTERGIKKRTFDYAHKIPPQDQDLERLLLGMYINKPELMEGINQAHLNTTLFGTQHVYIHQSMMDLGKKLDIHTLTQDLKKKDLLDRIGTEAYLEELVKIGKKGKEELIPEYFKELEISSVARAGISFGGKLAEELFDPETYKKSIFEYIRKKSLDILDILPFRFRLREDLKAATEEVIEDFEDLIKRKGKPKITTGYKVMDRIMHGVRSHKLHVVGADTKIGKTTFCLNIADNVANQGHHVLIFSYISSRKELIQKLISKYAGFDSEKFEYFEEISGKEITDVKKAAIETVGNLPILIETGTPDIDYIINRSKQVKIQYPDLALVIVDEMQSFQGHIPYKGNKSDVYYEILKKLKKNVSEELRLSTIIASQIKQEVLKSKTRKPFKRDHFSDSKGLGEVVDSAFFLYRPEEYWPEEGKYQGWMQVIPVALRVGGRKGKQGKLGVNMVTSNIYEKDFSNESKE